MTVNSVATRPQKSTGSATRPLGTICAYTRDYMRLYRDVNNLPPKYVRQHTYGIAKAKPTPAPEGIEDYESMTKEELIDALIMARINEARLKKGYMVEGVGAEKKVIRFVKKNTK